MEKGDKVKIFVDPITQEELEGIAELINKQIAAKRKGDPEYWRVKFLEDGFICDRFVAKEKVLTHRNLIQNHI